MRTMTMRALLVAVLVAVAATGAAGAAGSGSAADVTIEGRDFFWSPADVTIQVGDTVTWTNQQGFHNVVVGTERLNNPGFPGDDSWRPPPQKTFTAPGSYPYLCEVHGGMTGTITVTGDGEPTPTPTPTPTPEPVPPPGGGSGSDTVAPALSGVALSSGAGSLVVDYTVSEPATLNARLVARDGTVQRFRAHSQAGTWRVERSMPAGRYRAELWATDAWGNRSSTHTEEVRVNG
jgi:plastocyanin